MRHAAARLSLGMLVITALVACGGGGDDDGGGTASTATTAAGGGDRVSTTAVPDKKPVAAPRWEELASFSGPGAVETAEFSVVPGAIQWRVRWSCEAGTVQIDTLPALKKGTLVTSPCPKEGTAYSIQTGPRRLRVEAAGPWKVTVDQQVDTPVEEPPLPEMASGRVIATGEFHRIERSGKGTARLYELADGRRAVRFEGFEVSQNTDLFVWLSEAADPKTSADVVAVPHQEIALLTSTLGSQNYLVPPELPTAKIRSVVIWCAPVRIAYTAAALKTS